jgi:hypothetical protein
LNKPVTLLSVKLVEMDVAALRLPRRLGYFAFWPVISKKFAPSEILLDPASKTR